MQGEGILPTRKTAHGMVPLQQKKTSQLYENKYGCTAFNFSSYSGRKRIVASIITLLSGKGRLLLALWLIFQIRLVSMTFEAYSPNGSLAVPERGEHFVGPLKPATQLVLNFADTGEAGGELSRTCVSPTLTGNPAYIRANRVCFKGRSFFDGLSYDILVRRNTVGAFPIFV